MEMTPFTRPRSLEFLRLWVRLAGPARGGADGDAPLRRKALWGARAESKVVGTRWGRPFVFSWCRARAASSFPAATGGAEKRRRRQQRLQLRTPSCPLSGEPVPLPPPSHCLLCVWCVKAGASTRAAPWATLPSSPALLARAPAAGRGAAAAAEAAAPR